MDEKKLITQICVVVHDARQVSANWAKILGLPEATIATIFPDGALQHYTADGQPVEYKGIQVAKYDLGNFVLEILQPAPTPSPWRAFLDKNGPGVFHFCVLVDDRKGFQQKLTEIGVDLPYHIGYFPAGSYSYVAAREQLGLELSVNTLADYQSLFQGLLDGSVRPMDELR